MQAYPAIGTFSHSPNGRFPDAPCLTKGWVNVSSHAAGHGLAAQVRITRAHNFMCGLNTSMHRRKFGWTLPAATAAAGLAPSITEPEQSMSTTLTPARFTHRVP